MIDLLLKLLAKLGKLAELRSARKQRAVKEMVEPIFDDLLEIHKNYLLLFEKARTLAEQNPDDSPKAVKYLEKKRAEFEPVTVKVRAFAWEFLRDRKSLPMDHFVLSVASYFPVGDIVAGGTMSTSLIATLNKHIDSKAKFESFDTWDREMVERLPGTLEQRQMLRHEIGRVFFGPPFQSQVELIDIFLEVLRQRWQQVCESFASIKSADLKR